MSNELPTPPAPAGTPLTASNASQQTAGSSAAPPLATKNPATGWEKVALCLFLIVFSILTLWRTFHVIAEVNDAALVESSVTWELPPGAHLRIGPAAFHHDPDRNRLSYRGPLDASQQLQLRDLLEFDGDVATAPSSAARSAPSRASAPNAAARSTPSDSVLPSMSASAVAAARAASAVEAAKQAARAAAAGSARSAAPAGSAGSANADPAISSNDMKGAMRSYYSAIDLLAYKAQGTQARQVQLLLYLGALGGLLGALLRSFVDFVGNACYKEQLDLVVWWPLYATRPMVGAILGFLLVVLFKAKLLTSTDIQTGSDSFWWLGMAAIGGFSTIDVTARLRQAAKALFGSNEKDK